MTPAAPRDLTYLELFGWEEEGSGTDIFTTNNQMLLALKQRSDNHLLTSSTSPARSGSLALERSVDYLHAKATKYRLAQDAEVRRTLYSGIFPDAHIAQ